jgi:hypothetical protein
MESNTHSSSQPTRQADRLAELTAAINDLAAQDASGLPAAVQADQVLELRRLLDRLEGLWLQQLATVDAAGAAGADQGVQAPSTAGWLRARLRMGSGTATTAVRTARALFRGPLPATAVALVAGELSPAHAAVLAHGTHDLHDRTIAEAEPMLVEVARRLDPPRLRRLLGHLRLVADPDGERDQAERRYGRRGLWLSATWEGMVALNGLLEAEAGQIVLAALEPLARPVDADDTRSGGQRSADALTELARRALEGGRLPQTGGVRPQLLVTVDLGSLLGQSGALGGDAGGAGPLDPEACRRLACDGAVTRVLVTRQPRGQPPDPTSLGTAPDFASDAGLAGHPDPAGDPDSAGDAGLPARLRAAMALLPPILGGAASQPLDVGRTSRVIQPAQRAALVVRDRGCVFPGCDRPPPWCEGHHLLHWLDGGPTDLTNLALLCRAHHRAIHEGGWQLTRDPDGRFTATPSDRRTQHRRHHTAAA